MSAPAPPTAAPERALRGRQVVDGVWGLPVLGAFDLEQTRSFGFGQRDGVPSGAPFRLAFCLDSSWEQVGAVVSAGGPGVVQISAVGAPVAAVAAQVARVLSLDVDARGYDALGTVDPLVGALQRARPGLRPPLFHSAYEALCWSVLSARRPARQMAQVREQLARAHGGVVELAGEALAVFPAPEQLLRVREFAPLPAVKVERLHAIAAAALAGDLDTDALRALDPAEAGERLRRLPGIGPFYGELVTVRTLGHTDVLPTAEEGSAAIAGELLGRAVGVPELAALGAGWSPWRSWVCVALRAAGPAALAAREGGPRQEPSRRAVASSS
jgi:DNA-3-methyladenine glycosylase II